MKKTEKIKEKKRMMQDATVPITKRFGIAKFLVKENECTDAEIIKLINYDSDLLARFIQGRGQIIKNEHSAEKRFMKTERKRAIKAIKTDGIFYSRGGINKTEFEMMQEEYCLN